MSADRDAIIALIESHADYVSDMTVAQVMADLDSIDDGGLVEVLRCVCSLLAARMTGYDTGRMYSASVEVFHAALIDVAEAFTRSCRRMTP